MNTLQAELRRLYLFDNSPNPSQGTEATGLIAPDGRVRAMVLELARPAEWSVLSTVWQGVQAELGLPAPAIAISGVDGYQLWFSLAEPVTLAQARGFLDNLRLRYLRAIAPERIGMMPCATHHAHLVPALQESTGVWSAFVAPDLAAIFGNEPWLDVCPNAEAQAHVLARLECIKATVFEKLMTVSAPIAEPSLAANENSLTPKRFLHNVMNDPTIAMPLRIDAAKALLPYL